MIRLQLSGASEVVFFNKSILEVAHVIWEALMPNESCLPNHEAVDPSP